MKKKTIKIITNYGKKIGMGHFYRGEKIKKNLIDKYKTEHFFFKEKKLNFKKLKKIVSKKDILIIDIKFPKDQRFINSISKLDNRKIGIDPTPKAIKLFNLVWYPGIVKKKSLKKVKIFSGKDSIIPNGKIDNEIIGEKNAILFFTGGSDLKKIGDYLPNKLNNIDNKYKKIWIKSKFSKKPIIKNKKKYNWKIINNKKNFYSKKIKAKIAFCIFGTTFFELAFKGIPTVVYDPYKNPKHLVDLKILESLNLAILAKKKSEISKKINLLLNDDTKYKEVYRNLRKYFSEKKNKITILKKITKFIN